MCMGTTAGLHRRDLFWISDVRDIEDSYSAEAVLLRRGRMAFLFMPLRRRRIGRKTLCATVQATVRHLYGHKKKMPVYRHIPLAPRTDQRRQQLRFRRIRDVIDADSVEVA